MKKTFLITTLAGALLWLAGCTVVEEHHVRGGPPLCAPPVVRMHARRLPPPGRYVIRPGRRPLARHDRGRMR